MLFRNAQRRRNKGFGLIEGMVVLAIIAMFIVFVLPALYKAREAAAREKLTNNLKETAIGFHAYHDAWKCFPFNGSDTAVGNKKYTAKADPKGYNSGSWAYQILPYVDQEAIWRKIDRTKGVAVYMDSARMRPLVETSNGGGAWTDYFINGYLNNPREASNPSAADNKRRLVSVPDGTSYTIMVGQGNIDTRQYQSAANVTLSTNIYLGGTSGTMRSGDNTTANKPNDPTGVTLQRDSDKAPVLGSWGGPLPQGALMGMADATVRIFPYNMKQFSAFLTPDGAEDVTLPD